MNRKPQPEEKTDAWMATYSDLVTLLLTFFVLLFSMSSVNSEKWEQFIQAFANPGEDTAQVVIASDGDKGEQLTQATGDVPPPGDGDSLEQAEQNLPVDFNELYEFLKSFAESQGMGQAVEISKGENKVYIRFQNNIFFAPDESVLLPEAFPILDFLGDCLNAVNEDVLLVNINGHTAAVPNSDYYQVSDWMLSSERASSIAIYLDDKKKVDPLKLRPMGYGKNFPIASNDSAEGRMRNRRVDMVIVGKDAVLNTNDPMYEEFKGMFDPNEFPSSGGLKDLLVPDEIGGIAAESSQENLAEAQTQPTDTPAEDTVISDGTELAPESPQGAGTAESTS